MDERWRNFLSRDDGHRVGLIRFQAVKNPDLNRAWVDASRHWVEDVGGERVYAGDLDVVQGRAAFSFEQLLVEEYPSRQAAVEVMDRSNSDIEVGLRDDFVIAARPESRMTHKLVALVGRVIKTLARVDVVEVTQFEYRRDAATAGLSSDEAQIDAFHRVGQWQPFFMINMNEFSRRSEYDAEDAKSGAPPQSGQRVYEKYVRNTAVEVYRRGGNFFWIATPIAVLKGDSNHPLARQWSQFVLVCWPSRMALRHMLMSARFERGVPHRNAGLANALAIPGTPWPDCERYAL